MSAQCLVMVSNYPEGNETFSGVFTITDATGTSRGNQRTGSAHHDVRVAAHRSASAVVLNVTSPSEGIAHLIDLRGRTVGSFRLAKGVQGLTLPSLQGGRYLLEISHAGGERRTVVVDAF